MKTDAVIGSYLPTFTDKDKEALKLGLDFIALNYYTSSYVTVDKGAKGQYTTTNTRNGQPIGIKAGVEWQYLFAPGLRKLLSWAAKRYPSSEFWVSELGVAVPNEAQLSIDLIIKDQFRIDFFNTHLQAIMDACLLDGVPVKTVLVWSLLDNWEWQFGYTSRFGVIAVDYNSGSLNRTIKDSGYWLKDYFSYTPTRNFTKQTNTTSVQTLPTAQSNKTNQGETLSFSLLKSYLFVTLLWNFLL
jgi:beta-glucosidase